jgi:hypothetical protein
LRPRKHSAEARGRISEAQKKWWARQRKVLNRLIVLSRLHSISVSCGWLSADRAIRQTVRLRIPRRKRRRLAALGGQTGPLLIQFFPSHSRYKIRLWRAYTYKGTNMHSSQDDSRRDQLKRPYTRPCLEKLTPTAAREKLERVVPKDPSIQQMVRHLEESTEAKRACPDTRT